MIAPTASQRYRSTAATLCLALAACSAVAAQAQVESNLPGAGFDTPATPDNPDALAVNAPVIKVYSRETVVDVLVTDDKGNPVRGLRRSDFTVLEDDKPQPLRSFAEYSKDAPRATAPALPPYTYSNARALPASGPVQIFLFELLAVNEEAILREAGTMERAKKYLADYLRTMPAGTQAAVFLFRRDKGLQLLQGFTADGTKAAAAVDNLDVGYIRLPPKYDPIAAMDQIADYAAGVHGRKNLIWVIPGVPVSLMIARDGGLAWYPPGVPPDMTVVHRLMDTYDRYTAEQIAIYPLDPNGVHMINPQDIEVASGTGGSADINTNDYKGAVTKIVDHTTHYYTLSYIPPRPDDDGHYHPIKIEVDRPHVHLVYRSGYNDEHTPSADQVLKVQMTQASMGMGSLPSTQLLFDVKVAPSTAPAPQQADAPPARKALSVNGKQSVSYDTLYKLDSTQIAFTQTPDQMRTGALEFDLAAYDFYGKLVALRSQTLKLTLTPEEYEEFVQTPFQFFLPIDLPPGKITLRSGVFDNVANKTGTLEIPLTVAKAALASAAASRSVPAP